MACTRHLPLGLLLLALVTSLVSCGGNETPTGFTHPEDRFTYAVSHLVVPMSRENSVESMERLLRTIEQLESGTSFLDLARSQAGTDPNVPMAGWMGFMKPQQPDAIAGAYQALQPGQRGGPVQQEPGAHFLMRHTFEEGREIERQQVIPAYGFIIPYSDEDPEHSAEELEQRAKDAWGKVNSGEMTLAQAAQAYDAQLARPDGFLANAKKSGQHAEVYGIVEQLEPGELAPVSKVEGALLVVRRGVYFRSHIRHILIQHVESSDRPLTVSRSKDDAKALAQKVLAELADGSLTWEDAVKRHSDDLSTAGLYGWIGAMTNGDLIPAFEEAILATAPGELVSDVVELDDGFHILYRVN